MRGKTRPPSLVFLGLLALTVATFSGCSAFRSSPAAAPPVILTPTFVSLSPTAPPDPKPESIPVPDYTRREAWRPGYWSYDDGRFSWVSGEMIAKPSFTAVWAPDHWEKRQYGWAFVGGYWQ